MCNNQRAGTRWQPVYYPPLKRRLPPHNYQLYSYCPKAGCTVSSQCPAHGTAPIGFVYPAGQRREFVRTQPCLCVCRDQLETLGEDLADSNEEDEQSDEDDQSELKGKKPYAKKDKCDCRPYICCTDDTTYCTTLDWRHPDLQREIHRIRLERRRLGATLEQDRRAAVQDNQTVLEQYRQLYTVMQREHRQEVEQREQDRQRHINLRDDFLITLQRRNNQYTARMDELTNNVERAARQQQEIWDEAFRQQRDDRRQLTETLEACQERLGRCRSTYPKRRDRCRRPCRGSEIRGGCGFLSWLARRCRLGCC